MRGNVWVTGANGQLGSEFRALAPEYQEYQFIFTDRESLNITDFSKVMTFVMMNNIEIIVNCAAYTAADRAETDVEMANAVNHLAVANLALIAASQNSKLVHISTDYVFDGTANSPYVETHMPNPKTSYGQTKLNGEQAMQAINPANSIIIRTSWVYSNYGNNFVKTMLRLGQDKGEVNVVTDQVGSPTNAENLALAIVQILPQLKNDAVELFHYSNEGVCSWYDFAKAIFESTGVPVKVHPIPTAQYPAAAKRPLYSVLDKTKIKETYHLEIPYWKDSLGSCLRLLG